MNASAKDNALPGGGQAARKENQTDNSNHSRLGAGVPEWLAPRQSGWIDSGLAGSLAFLAVAVLLLAIGG